MLTLTPHVYYCSEINFRYTQDDFPYTTELTLEEGAAGKTNVAALIVMDGITNAEVSHTWSQRVSCLYCRFLCFPDSLGLERGHAAASAGFGCAYGLISNPFIP